MMKSRRSRLDRFLSKRLSIKRKDIRLILAQGRVKFDGDIVNDSQLLVDQFTHIQFDEHILQANRPCYMQLNKPKGVVSATKDHKHSTVMDLINYEYPKDLHIVGRLDFNSTGLVLLTNDGRWSRKISEPQNKVKKSYLVSVDKTISPEVITAFAKGIYFPYEKIKTRPVELLILNEACTEAKVIMEEGRYHQIKRMFGRFQLEVLDLHRESVGDIVLDKTLLPGESRHLNKHEIDAAFC